MTESRGIKYMKNLDLKECRDKLDVIDKEIVRLFSGIKRRAVAFLVRLERIAVGIKAERLAHHPIRPLNVAAVQLVIRLIAQTRQDQRFSMIFRCSFIGCSLIF